MRAAKKHVLRSSKLVDEELRKVIEYKRELDFEDISRGQSRRHWEVQRERRSAEAKKYKLPLGQGWRK